MATIRQYVNLPLSLDKHYGRYYWLQVKIKEKKPGASEGQLVYLFCEDNGENMDPKFVSSFNRAGGFAFNPKHRKLVMIQSKLAMGLVKLSNVGGDKYKFKVGKKFDKSGAKDAKQDVEIWRKIFVRHGYMKPTGGAARIFRPVPQADWGTVKTELDKVFIELEEDGPSTVTHEPWSRTDSPIRNLDRGKGAMEFPDQSTKLVFVDRIGKASWTETHTFRFSGGRLGGTHDWTIPGGVYTWPETDWVRGFIDIRDSSGDTILSITDVGKIRSTVKKKGGYRHPDGKVTKKIRFDFGSWLGLDNLKRIGGSVKIRLRIRIIDDTAMGLAWPSPPKILIATHHPISYDAGGYLENTTIHELGHNLGLNVKNLEEFDPDSGAHDDWVENGTWYDNSKGGVGTHCSTGAHLEEETRRGVTREVYKDGTCTMLHYTNGKVAFCDMCARNLKLARLRKLGKRNVWPKG